jgi:hypothetical protein
MTQNLDVTESMNRVSGKEAVLIGVPYPTSSEAYSPSAFYAMNPLICHRLHNIRSSHDN